MVWSVSKVRKYTAGVLILEIADPALTSAVFSGLTANQSLSDIPGQCPTGNCTWTAYKSLGICSYTEDISSTIEKSPDVSYDSNETSMSLNLTLPLFHSPRPNFYPSSTALIGQDGFWVASLINRSYNSSLNQIGEAYVVYFPPCAVQNFTSDIPVFFDPEWLEIKSNYKNWKAFKASFSFCIQTLASATFNGSTETKLMETTTENDPRWRVLEPEIDTE